MKKILCAALFTVASTGAFAADVGVSITVGDPGFYGRIDLGNVPRPQVIYTNPVIIERPRIGYIAEPVYLRVPPGHAKNWSKHCYRYDACGRRVYFVQDNWYSNVYAPRVREHGHEWERDRRDDYHGRDDRRGDDDHDRGDKHGRGHGKGNKHDRD
jgi:hypothetical protein